MSAVLFHKWTISPDVDIVNKTAQQLDELWKTSMGPVDAERQAYLDSMVAEGLTEGPAFLTEFDTINRIMTRQREFINVAAGTQYIDWFNAHIPETIGGFTRVDYQVLDGDQLSKRGKYIIA